MHLISYSMSAKCNLTRLGDGFGGAEGAGGAPMGAIRGRPFRGECTVPFVVTVAVDFVNHHQDDFGVP